MRVLVQSRMSSSRLPGKALMTIAGSSPLVEVVARRGMNRGAELIVVTSRDESDDPLAAFLERRGLVCFRGSLDDVLGRALAACEDLSDAHVVARLTGDNPLPDQGLVETLRERLISRGLDYVGIKWPEDGLPYGVSAEVFRLGVLRRAHEQTRSPFDREHMTPWLRRNCRAGTLGAASVADLSYLRATVDCLDDYVHMSAVLNTAGADPMSRPWQKYCQSLSERPDAPLGRVPLRAVGGTPGDTPAAKYLSQVAVDLRREDGPRPSTMLRLRQVVDMSVNLFLADASHNGSLEILTAMMERGWHGRFQVVLTAECPDASLIRSNLDRLTQLGCLMASSAQTAVIGPELPPIISGFELPGVPRLLSANDGEFASLEIDGVGHPVHELGSHGIEALARREIAAVDPNGSAWI